MIGTKSLVVALISSGLTAGAMQMVHASTAAAAPTVQRMDDDYPNIRAGLHHLREAKDSLLNAEPKFKGHRDKALGDVDDAIHECETALAEG